MRKLLLVILVIVAAVVVFYLVTSYTGEKNSASKNQKKVITAETLKTNLGNRPQNDDLNQTKLSMKQIDSMTASSNFSFTSANKVRRPEGSDSVKIK